MGPKISKRTVINLYRHSMYVGQMSYTQRKKGTKKYPWGTIAKNGTVFSKGHSFFLNNHVCGKKSAPEQKGTI